MILADSINVPVTDFTSVVLVRDDSRKLYNQASGNTISNIRGKLI